MTDPRSPRSLTAKLAIVFGVLAILGFGTCGLSFATSKHELDVGPIGAAGGYLCVVCVLALIVLGLTSIFRRSRP